MADAKTDPRAEPEVSVTLESMPSQPEGKKTVNLPAMTDRALLEDLYRTSRSTEKTVDRLEGTVSGLVVDGRDLHGRMNRFEGRLDKLENPSVQPPPLNSTGVRALINQHPSAMDLEQQAALAAEIVKNQERDKRIEETHALAAKAADVLAQQSDYMGMGKKGAQWLFSEKGRTAMAQAAAGLVAAYEILKHGGIIK